MTFRLGRYLAVLATCGAVGFLGACASGQDSGSGDPAVTVRSPDDDYVSRFSAEEDDAGDRASRRTEAESPEGSDSGGATSEVAERSRGAGARSGGDDLKVTDYELEALANHYAKLAHRYYGEGEYDRALKYADDALQMDPDNEFAAQVKGQVEEILGVDAGHAANLARSRSEEESALRGEALYEINAGLDEADRLMRSGEYTEAIVELEKVLDVIRWTGYMLDTEGFEREARLMLQEAQAGLEDARLREYVRTGEQERRLRELEMQEELDRYREEIRNLYETAKDYFDRREYADCMIVLDKILREDPYNEEVARLKTIARSLERGLADRDAFERFNRNWKEVVARIADATAFPENDLTAPDAEHWSRVESRSKRLEAQRRTPLSKEDIAVRSALENVDLPLAFDETPLDDVVSRLRTEGKINIVLAKEIRENVGDYTVDLNVGRIRMRQALDLIVSELDLSWRIENGAVIIDQAGEEVGRNFVRRVFNVADLLINLRTFAGEEPRLAEDTDNSLNRIAAEEEEEDAEPATIEDLIEIIQEVIPSGESGWDPEITYRQQDLIVVNTPDVVDKVANLLDDLRRSQGLTVAVEARFIKIRDDFLEDIGLDFRGIGGSPQIPAPGNQPVPATLDDIQFGTAANPAGPGGTGNDAGFFFQDMPPSGNVRVDQRARVENLFDQALGGVRGGVGLTASGGASFQLAFVDNPEINAIIRAVRKRERATMLTAPRVTVHNSQRANVSMLNEIAYIADFDTSVATGVAVANPVVDIIRDGIVLDVRPTVSADRRYITLELRPTLATLVRPIPTFTTSLGVGTPVAIQTPQLTLQRIRTTVTVPDGGSFVIGGMRMMSETQQESGIPVLSDLPLIGPLFKRQGKSVVRQDILIIVSARIFDVEEEMDLRFESGLDSPR